MRPESIAALPIRDARIGAAPGSASASLITASGGSLIDTDSRLLITCEHAGNDVPAEYGGLFEGRRALLATHRGWDPGALVLARDLAAAFQSPLFFTETTRLLIDVNRSLRTPDLHSEITKALPMAQRREIVRRYWQPHRERVEGWVRSEVAEGHRVVHIASHSFTPELHGHVRTADVGFLYDPRRPGEVDLCRRWIAALRELRPDLRLRRNYPYLGRSDGLTFRLRREYTPERYVGIELEVNQQFVERGGPAWPGIRAALVTSLGQVLETVPSGTPDGASDASESSPSTQPSNAPPAQDRERVDS
jgi:predicted N-formylglutamate amidohydrolase